MMIRIRSGFSRLPFFEPFSELGMCAIETTVEAEGVKLSGRIARER